MRDRNGLRKLKRYYDYIMAVADFEEPTTIRNVFIR